MSGLKAYIQSQVAQRIPDAFTLRKAELPCKVPTGIHSLDHLIHGFQRGDMTEIYGHDSSGRTTIAMSFMAEVTRRQEVCALVDVSDSVDPESLFVAGVDLNRLLWIRCGSHHKAFSNSIPTDPVRARKQNRRISNLSARQESSFSSGQHPRHEVRGLSHAIAALMGSEGVNHPPVVPPFPRGDLRGGPLTPLGGEGARKAGEGACVPVDKRDDESPQGASTSKAIWARLEQALRVTDLLLNNGGFGTVVLDLGDVPVENSRRIPLTSWFRFRHSVENTPTVLVLLSREPCSGTCASLLLRCQCCQARWLSAGDYKTDLTLEGLDLLVDVTRCRGQSQAVTSGTYSSLGSSAHWRTRMAWSR